MTKEELKQLSEVMDLRNYQRAKNNPYILPHNLYRRVLYLIKDYDRLKNEWEAIIYDHTPPDGMPRGSGISNPTHSKAVRREKIFKQMEAVDQGIMEVPEEYRHGIISHVKYGERFPDLADRKTWFAYQSKFLYHVAERLGEI